MKAQIIGKLLYLALVGLLIAAIVRPDTGFVPMAVTAVWLLNLLMIGLSVALALTCAGAKSTTPARDQYLKALREIAAKVRSRGVIGKSLSIAQDIILACLAAYAGFVFTVIVFVIGVLLVRLSMSMARDAVKSADAEVAA
ncbi:hypothetical protein LS633_25290 [Pseudomonas sp. NIBR-H-19]|uniref:hypothetical protein n=1 Tax=Pseudomonas sp. NIBR-H-19 TaxID=2901380 RepID=UPI001E38665E|nr:hypothetical protein [Pseudomonas sp. NIBR-H-19]UHC81683.1 hypothetical protein LS633_25290 [Pseudomonas sp. NIBR-H-19]